MGRKRSGRAKRAGRKHDPDAKRHQTTAAGQGRAAVGASEELTAKRLAVAGDDRIGIDFPLDVLQARGFITSEMRDEGLRFAALAWSIYGFPMQSCQALYERMVADGIGTEMSALRAEGEDPDRDDWQRRQATLYARMARALGWRGPGTPSGECFIAVRDAAQHCRMPRLVADLIEGRPSRVEAYSEMAALVAGLKALVRAGERKSRAKAAAPDKICALTRDEQRAEERRIARGWFAGPLVLSEEALARLRSR